MYLIGYISAFPGYIFTKVSLKGRERAVLAFNHKDLSRAESQRKDPAPNLFASLNDCFQYYEHDVRSEIISHLSVDSSFFLVDHDRDLWE
jgi:hypothetical protein